MVYNYTCSHVALHQRVLQRGCREGAVRVEDEVAGGVPRAFAGLPAAFTVEDGRGVAVAVKDPDPKRGWETSAGRLSAAAMAAAASFCYKTCV